MGWSHWDLLWWLKACPISHWAMTSTHAGRKFVPVGQVNTFSEIRDGLAVRTITRAPVTGFHCEWSLKPRYMLSPANESKQHPVLCHFPQRTTDLIFLQLCSFSFHFVSIPLMQKWKTTPQNEDSYPDETTHFARSPFAPHFAEAQRYVLQALSISVTALGPNSQGALFGNSFSYWNSNPWLSSGCYERSIKRRNWNKCYLRERTEAKKGGGDSANWRWGYPASWCCRAVPAAAMHWLPPAKSYTEQPLKESYVS